MTPSRSLMLLAFLVCASTVVLDGCVGEDVVRPEGTPRVDSGATDGPSGATDGPSGTTDATVPPTDAGLRKIVFATKNLYRGDFGAGGGLTAADAICKREAAVANLPGTYLAWLSDGASSPSTRFTRSAVPYTLVDGTLVARSFADLVAAPAVLAHEINRDANGDPAISIAFTGTAAAGTSTAAHCNGWSDVAAGATVGGLGKTGSDWTDQEIVPCRTTARLICFEQ